jgi:hypothetical protein
LPRPPQCANPLDGEEALGRAHLAVARQVRQLIGWVPFSPPVRGAAQGSVRHADGRLLAGERFLERDLHVMAQVAAARAGWPPPPP